MRYYIGIDIGGMSIKVGVVNQLGELLVKETCPTRVVDGFQAIVEDCYALCQKAVEVAKLSISDIFAVGVGCPGTIWSEKGIVTFSSNLNFTNVSFIKEFQKHWDIPIFIDNDANCAVIGEYLFGNGKGTNSCICITLGTGVGGGIVIDGEVFRGEKGAGTEVGHMVIKIDSEEQCGCGRKGCWEVYASATAMIRETKKAMALDANSLMHKLAVQRGKVSGRIAFEAAKLGDKSAQELVERYIGYIGCGVVNLINIFRPDKLLIGGGVSNEGQYIIDMIQSYVDKYHYGGETNPKTLIMRASLTNDAGIIGAAALAIKTVK